MTYAHFEGHRLVGSSTWTTANGDQLYVETEQDFLPDGVNVGPYTIVGGTGRFVDVTGSGTLVTIATVNSDGTVTLAGSFDGTISY